MKKYRILCLTDHDTHSKENSLYAIVSAMSQYDNCKELIVASRSAKINEPFFYDFAFTKIYGKKAAGDFNFEEARKELHENLVDFNPIQFDLIFLRLPRPTSDAFLRSLEKHFAHACIVNNPSGIITCSNKSVLLNFQNVCPPVRLCKSIDDILQFSRQYDVVLKPLKEYGGKGLLKIQRNVLNDGSEDHNTLEYLKTHESFINREGYLAMKYLENVSQGDKRLIVVDGEILAASLRLPAKDSWLCNVAMGGKSIKSHPDQQEFRIIKTINPYLKNMGILIYGADTLVDDDGIRTLSEINALSIGGFPQAEQQTGKPIIDTTINKIFAYADVQLNR